MTKLPEFIFKSDQRPYVHECTVHSLLPDQVFAAIARYHFHANPTCSSCVAMQPAVKVLGEFLSHLGEFLHHLGELLQCKFFIRELCTTGRKYFSKNLGMKNLIFLKLTYMYVQSEKVNKSLESRRGSHSWLDLYIHKGAEKCYATVPLMNCLANIKYFLTLSL